MVQGYSRILFCHGWLYIHSKTVSIIVFNLIMISLILRNCFAVQYKNLALGLHVLQHRICFLKMWWSKKAVVFWQYDFIFQTVVLRQYAYLSSPMFDTSCLVKYNSDTDNDNSNSNNGRMSDHYYHNLYPQKKSSPSETEPLKRSSVIYDAQNKHTESQRAARIISVSQGVDISHICI